MAGDGRRKAIDVEGLQTALLVQFLANLNPDPRRVGHTQLIDTAACLRDPPEGVRFPAFLRARSEAEVRRRGRWAELERYEAACERAGADLVAEAEGQGGALDMERVIERIDAIPTPGMDA